MSDPNLFVDPSDIENTGQYKTMLSPDLKPIDGLSTVIDDREGNLIHTLVTAEGTIWVRNKVKNEWSTWSRMLPKPLNISECIRIAFGQSFDADTVGPGGIKNE